MIICRRTTARFFTSTLSRLFSLPLSVSVVRFVSGTLHCVRAVIESRVWARTLLLLLLPVLPPGPLPEGDWQCGAKTPLPYNIQALRPVAFPSKQQAYSMRGFTFQKIAHFLFCIEPGPKTWGWGGHKLTLCAWTTPFCENVLCWMSLESRPGRMHVGLNESRLSG